MKRIDCFDIKQAYPDLRIDVLYKVEYAVIAPTDALLDAIEAQIKFPIRDPVMTKAWQQVLEIE